MCQRRWKVQQKIFSQILHNSGSHYFFTTLANNETVMQQAKIIHSDIDVIALTFIVNLSPLLNE